MSIFSPSRGTGSFGKGVENIGSLFPTQASSPTFNISQSVTAPSQQPQGAEGPSRRQEATMRSAGSSVRFPQRVSMGTVHAGRTGQTVSSTGTSSHRRSSGREGSQSSSQASTSPRRTPTTVEYISWASPRSTVKVNKETREIRENNYRYFPIVSDQDLPQLRSAVDWSLFSSLVSDVRIEKPDRYSFHLDDVEQVTIPFFELLALDLRKPESLTDETSQAYRSANMWDSSHMNDIPIAVFKLLRNTMRSSGWLWISGGAGLSDQDARQNSKIYYLKDVTRQLRRLKSKQNEVLQAMFQMFMDAHFPVYNRDLYRREDLQRFASLGITLQPLATATAQSVRRKLYAIWGGCFQLPQQMSEVTSPTFSKSSAQVSGGKAVLDTGRQNPFPLGDFVSAIASEGYLQPNTQVEGFGASFYSQNPQAAKLNFTPIYKASNDIKRQTNSTKTLGLFVNASTMVKAYPQEVGTGNLAYRVARVQFDDSRLGYEALLHFLSTGTDHPEISASLKKQAPELGSGANSSRYVDMSLLFSTLFLIDFMSCKGRRIRREDRTSVGLGTNRLGDHVRNFLNWIPQRAEFVATRGVLAKTPSIPRPSIPSGLNIRMPRSSTSRRPVPSKGGKTRVGLTPVRSGKSMSPFRSITAALARKQGKPTQSSPSRRSGVASPSTIATLRRGLVGTGESGRRPVSPSTRTQQQPKFATALDVRRVLLEPNVKRTLQHIELPLDPKTVLEFGKLSLGRPLPQSFVDDLVLGMVAFWVAYPQMTKSVSDMLGNAQKLMQYAQSDKELAALSQGLEDMFMLDDPEFTKALMQLPRRSVKPIQDGMILTEVELPSDDPSFDEVAVDVVVDQNTGDAVAVPVEEIQPPITDIDVVPPQIQPSLPDIDLMPTDQLQPPPMEIGPSVEPPSGGGSAVASGSSTSEEGETSKEEKTNYTPWIIGGVATVAIGTGVFMYMNKRKQSI